MGRYELIRLAQLMFALALMFGAFSAGLAIGWWRWGRPSTEAPERRRPQSDRPVEFSHRAVSPDLFTPGGAPPEGPGGVPEVDSTTFSPGPRELESVVDPFGR